MDNGEWVEGAWLPASHTIMYETGLGSPFSAWIVDPETVGQFTRLNDMYAKRIFEGDIVEPVLTDGTHKGFSWGRQVVVFDRGAFCLKDSRGQVTPMCNYAASVKFKVLGNVHDNPELLEVDE
jgi:uncharacterized phage protein (TIGR01671 family)